MHCSKLVGPRKTDLHICTVASVQWNLRKMDLEKKRTFDYTTSWLGLQNLGGRGGTPAGQPKEAKKEGPNMLGRCLVHHKAGLETEFPESVTRK